MAFKLPKSPNKPVNKKALKAIAYSAYGGRPYHELSYTEKRFGGCCYTRQDYDTDPLGSRSGCVGRLESIPNIANQTHHVWNSKESEFWRDMVRKEGISQKANMRVLKDLVRDSKVMYSRDRQPLTALCTEPPTMSEKSLRNLQMANSAKLLSQADKLGNMSMCGTGDDYASHILARHGLELTADRQRLRPKKESRVRIDEIEGLHMATIMHGPRSSRLKKSMKDHMSETAKSAHMMGQTRRSKTSMM